VSNLFQIRVKGSCENARDFEKVILPWGNLVDVHRDTSIPEVWHAIANDVSGKTIRERKDDLKKYRIANPNVTLWITAKHQDDLFDFAEAPFEKLDKFLENPRRWIFPPLSILPDGCKKCFENALDLATSAENLLGQHNILKHHVAFFLVTALEEFGKGLLILKEGKDAKEPAVAMSSFRSHYEKFEEMSKQLAGERQAGLTPTSYGRKKAVWDCLVEHLQASGRPDALKLSDPDILIILRRMRHPKEFYREETLGKIKHPGEIYREQTLYVDYVGSSKSWSYPQTQWSERQLAIMAKLLKMCCRIMINEIDAKERIEDVRGILDLVSSPDFNLASIS